MWLCRSEGGTRMIKAAAIFFLAVLLILWPLTSLACYFLHRWGRNHYAGDFLYLSAAGLTIILAAARIGSFTSLGEALIFGALYFIGDGFFVREITRRNSVTRLMLLLNAKHEESKKTE